MIDAFGAVLRSPRGTVALEPVAVDPPGPGEVTVRLAASGICRTDFHITTDAAGLGIPFPILLGHEGAGWVEEIGEGVTGLVPGDPVVVAHGAPCQRCRACRRGDPACWSPLRAKAAIRGAKDGERLHFVRPPTFCTHTILHSAAAIKIPATMPMDKACLLSCAVVTGVGAVFHTSPVWPGARVAVIGCGGVGLSTIQAARLAHAAQIIAVDTSPGKLKSAQRFGATDIVDASRHDPVEQVRELSDHDGVDFSFEAVGSPGCIDQAVRMLAYASTATIIGLPKARATVTLSLGDPVLAAADADTGLFWNKSTIRVSAGGDARLSYDIPWLAELYLRGELDLDSMVTSTIAFKELGEVFSQPLADHTIRSVVVFD